MDLCLSCKGCKSECPSNVDMAKLKGEFLQHYYDAHGVPLRSRLIGRFAQTASLAAKAPWLWNAVFGTPVLRRLANRMVGFHPDRTVPLAAKTTLCRWFAERPPPRRPGNGRRVHLFADEFTAHQDLAIGIAAVELLEGLGYEVVLPAHTESGRSALSKGLLRRARDLARENVKRLGPLVSKDAPLLGIEPSALLSFRDEYPDLLRGEEQQQARSLGEHCLLIDEFIAREIDAGRIDRNAFAPSERIIHLHGHCHQKALASQTPTVRMLELPAGHQVRLIPSGCCGMAGSFGYEKEHYALSQQIGELVLFPKIRDIPEGEIIAAPGTSCRHQIRDALGRRARHPVEILSEALNGKRI
jgi:Fe-S oxidoreductase